MMSEMDDRTVASRGDDTVDTTDTNKKMKARKEQQQLSAADGGTVDMFINASNAINKFFKCNPCNRYVLKQVDYEQKVEALNGTFDLQVYQQFFADDD